MEMTPQDITHEDIQRLMEDVEMLKEMWLANHSMPDPEGELTEWAKEELRRTRSTPMSEYISHEEVKKKLLSRK